MVIIIRNAAKSIYIRYALVIYDVIYNEGEIKMKNESNMKLTMLVVSILCIALLITPVCTAGIGAKEMIRKNNRINIFQENDKPTTAGTEYWALIFAVGIYKNNPDADRPSIEKPYTESPRNGSDAVVPTASTPGSTDSRSTSRPKNATL